MLSQGLERGTGVVMVDLLKLLVRLELEVLLYTLQLLCFAAQPCVQFLVSEVRFYLVLSVLYVTFLQRTYFAIASLVTSSPCREKVLEDRIYELQSCIEDLEERRLKLLETSIEHVEEDSAKEQQLLDGVVGERHRLVRQLQYLQACFDNARRHR